MARRFMRVCNPIYNMQKYLSQVNSYRLFPVILLIAYALILSAILGSQVANDWPDRGEIVFENVSLRYDADRNPVITDLSLKILAGQKVIH